MNLMVNDQPLAVGDGLTVRELIERLGFGRGPVAVEQNGQLVPRIEHRSTELRDGDVVEVIELAGGG